MRTQVSLPARTLFERRNCSQRITTTTCRTDGSKRRTQLGLEPERGARGEARARRGGDARSPRLSRRPCGASCGFAFLGAVAHARAVRRDLETLLYSCSQARWASRASRTASARCATRLVAGTGSFARARVGSPPQFVRACGPRGPPTGRWRASAALQRLATAAVAAACGRCHA